jgi:drug/metabolite transporter (DMT)-like permease
VKSLRNDAAMLLVCLIWGANCTVTKLAFAKLPPLAFTAVRFVIGSALLFAAVRLVEGRIAVPSRAALGRLVWLGLLGNTLYQFGFIFGLALGTATSTALIISSSPATVAVLAAALGIERTTPRARLGIALGMAGVAVVVIARSHGALRFGAGDLFPLGALVCWTVYTVGLRQLDGLSPLQITAWTTAMGTPGLVLAGIPDLLAVRWGAVDARTLAALAYAIVLSLIVGYLLWNRGVREVGATRTAIYMCVTPLVATLVAWAALGERPTWLHALGGALIACGVVLTRTGPAAS